MGEGGEQAELGPPLSIRAAGEACPNEGTVGRELTDVREWSMLFIWTEKYSYWNKCPVLGVCLEVQEIAGDQCAWGWASCGESGPRRLERWMGPEPQGFQVLAKDFEVSSNCVEKAFREAF